MTTVSYERLREKAIETASRIGASSFYDIHRGELDESLRTFRENRLVHRCISVLREATLHPAHGIPHCEKVALEAGALVMIEAAAMGIPRDAVGELTVSAQIAGLLHDIKRSEKDHTIMGSIEAARIIGDFELREDYKGYIAAAIRNHEAFKETMELPNTTAELLSNCLYDADKFRWGPDNFTATLWLIVRSAEMPLHKLYGEFYEKMDGIRRIKETFRTGTGKRYGPEFIDLGIEIGNVLFREMEEIINGY